MRGNFLFSVVVTVALAQPVSAQFVGELELGPTDCKNTGNCTLLNDFGFIDPNGVGWQAQAGLRTDGASIPAWAQPFIGEKFDDAFIKAAVIHDHYCIRRVRGFLQTHRVFYDALIANGVAPVRANTMYYAVLVGGPKWITVISGRPCKTGSNCINYLGAKPNLPDAKIIRGEGGDLYAWRDEIYDQSDVKTAISDGIRFIEAKELADPAAALALAREKRPEDSFLATRSALILDPGIDR